MFFFTIIQDFNPVVSIVQIQLAICCVYCDLCCLLLKILCCYQIEQFYIVLFIEQLCMLYYIQCCLLETTVVLLIKDCVLNLIVSIIHVVDQYMYA